jgi:hypothetical protein
MAAATATATDASGATAASQEHQRGRKQAAERVERLKVSLDEAVGASVRRVYKHQAVHARSSVAEIRQHLPELAAFIDAVRPPPQSHAGRHLRIMRRVFIASSASWLSHSARESGVTALLCRQLVQLAVDATEQHAAQERVLVDFAACVLLDALLTSCSSRLGCHCRACEWQQRRPKYHAMICALVWHALTPFLTSLALQWPDQVAEVIEAQYAVLRPRRMRVNCVFTQVAGVWTLVERLHASITENAPRSTVSRPVDVPKVIHLMQRLVQFIVRSKLLGEYQPSNGVETDLADMSVAGSPDFDDLLMEKAFAQLQGFIFSCSRSCDVAIPALQLAIDDALGQAASSSDRFFVAKVSVLTGISCVSVKGLADRIVTTLLSECRARQDDTKETKRQRRQLLRFAIGFAAHFDLVGLCSVMDLLLLLLEHYRESIDDQSARSEGAAFVVYVAFHRRESLGVLRAGEGSTTWQRQVSDKMLEFQDGVCGYVDPLDFRSLPKDWMAAFWKDWIGLTDADVEAFHVHCRSSDAEDEGAGKGQPFNWMASTASLPFRSWSTTLTLTSAYVRPHWIPPRDLDSSLNPPAKRKAARSWKGGRLTKRVERILDPEHEERKLSVLFLPDVMERICSFMSAKRLCRLASVCKAFAEVSRRESLWRPLWQSLASKEPEPTVCAHGASFQHNWMRMYWARTKAQRRVRRKQKRLASARNSDIVAIVSDSDEEDSAADGEPILQVCSFCDCHVVLTTTGHAARHMVAHKLHSCEVEDCGASFSSALKLKLHRRDAHPVRKRPKKSKLPAPTPVSEDSGVIKTEKNREKQEKPRVACGFEGCAKTYVSLKHLESHRKQFGHRVDS